MEKKDSVTTARKRGTAVPEELPESRDKRSEIIKAAQECFFEKGYEATSVRMTMKKVEAEVGLFYYYFENKAEVFDYAMELFLDYYKKDFEEITKFALRDPFGGIQKFFILLLEETRKYREQYAEHLHKTVRLAVREELLTLMTPYLRQIVETFVAVGVKPPSSVDVTAMLLTHGVGSLIIHQEEEWIHINSVEIRKSANLIMGVDPDNYELVNPVFAELRDMKGITEMAGQYRDVIMGYGQELFDATLENKILDQEVIVVRHYGQPIGFVGFSKKRKELGFLVVNEHYRKRGIGGELLMSALAQFPVGSRLTALVKCGEDDQPETGLRKLYRRFGFQEKGVSIVSGHRCMGLDVILPEKIADLRMDNAAWAWRDLDI